jgi:peptide deformylase
VAVLDILHIGHPLLRERAREVSADELRSPELQRFVDDLVETMRAARGAGLAAPQIGRSIRVCAIEVNDNPRYPYFPAVPLTILVNPVLRAIGDERFDNFEGCLSVPDLRGLVSRAASIEVTALDRDGIETTRTLHGLTAGTFQHETDHLDGKLFVDEADPRSLCTWAQFERFHKAAFIERIVPFIARMGG